MKISNWGGKKVKRTWIYFRHKRYIEVIFFASVKVLQQFIELETKKDSRGCLLFQFKIL
jgi:hypothetical protein